MLLRETEFNPLQKNLLIFDANSLKQEHKWLHKSRVHKRVSLELSDNVAWNQGDRIRRIFDFWEIVSFDSF
jgi:hypothetical protein